MPGFCIESRRKKFSLFLSEVSSGFWFWTFTAIPGLTKAKELGIGGEEEKQVSHQEFFSSCYFKDCYLLCVASSASHFKRGRSKRSKRNSKTSTIAVKQEASVFLFS